MGKPIVKKHTQVVLVDDRKEAEYLVKATVDNTGHSLSITDGDPPWLVTDYEDRVVAILTTEVSDQRGGQ